MTIDSKISTRIRRPKKLVTGDRDWDNVEIIANEISTWSIETIIIHGAARGADRIASLIAEQLGMEQRPYPYLRQFGRDGGPVRNRQMVHEEHHPDDEIEEIVAFHDRILNSLGTSDMLLVGRAHGIACRLLTSQGEVPIPWTELELMRKKRSKRASNCKLE